MPVQAIMRHTVTTVLTFTGRPSDETRTAMLAAGYRFDGKSKQWFIRDESIDLITEEKVVRDIGISA